MDLIELFQSRCGSIQLRCGANSTKNMDFLYFSTFETIGLPFVCTRSYQFLQKSRFFGLVLKGLLH